MFNEIAGIVPFTCMLLPLLLVASILALDNCCAGRKIRRRRLF